VSDLSDYFNPPRVKIAAFLLARDESCVSGPVSDYLKKWGMVCVKVGMTADHSGDCTKESHACGRCIADKALADADEILRLVGSPSQPEVKP
jgi:hypothetical protein